MQGSRVFHQVTSVTSGTERNTVVFSFQPRDVLALEACSHLGKTWNEVDPLDAFFPDWVRQRAFKIHRRMELWLECRNKYNRINKSKEGCICNCFTDSSAKSVVACRDNMLTLMKTVPYTSDREVLVSLMNIAIAPFLRFVNTIIFISDCIGGIIDSHTGTIIKTNSSNTTNNSTNSTAITTSTTPVTVFNMTCDKDDCLLYGHSNLSTALREAHSCNNDIMTLGKDDSIKMEYF